MALETGTKNGKKQLSLPLPRAGEEWDLYVHNRFSSIFFTVRLVFMVTQNVSIKHV